MANNTPEFQILIKYLQDKTKAEEALKEMDALKEKTKEVSREGDKAEQKIQDETEKTVTKKKQPKGMIQGVAHECPLLGQIGRLALNPISLSVAAVIGSFSLWKMRVDELVRSMGAIEMGDVSTQ